MIRAEPTDEALGAQLRCDLVARGLLLLVVVVIAGCSGNTPDDQPGEAAEPTSVPERARALVDLDEFTDAGIQATRLEPEIEGDAQLLVEADQIVGGEIDLSVVGDEGEVLVALVEEGLTSPLVRSTDYGESWQLVELPNGISTLESRHASQVDASLLVSATDPDDRQYILVSDDARTWRGGPVDLGPRGTGLGQYPGQLLDGRLAVPLMRSERDEGLLVSSDGGSSWQPVDCPAESVSDGFPGSCLTLNAEDGGLWLREHEVSLDEGQTWQTVEVRPDPGATASPKIAAAVAPSDGNWLGVTNVIVNDGGYNAHRAILARSADGLRWETVLSDPCSRTGMDYRHSWFSRPVPLGDGWVVASTCTSPEGEALRSELHLLDHDGTQPALLAAVDHDGVSFGAPIVSGTRVVIPEIQTIPDEHDQHVTFLQLHT
jgi:hypothetical protein